MTVLAVLAGVFVGALLTFWWTRAGADSVRAQVSRMLADAERERERMLRGAEVDAKAALLAVQEEQELSAKRQRDEFAQSEKRLRQRETQLERRAEATDKRERDLKQRESQLVESEQHAQKTLAGARASLQQAQTELTRIAGLTAEEAKAQLLASIENDAKKLAATRVKQIEENARKDADEKARSIVATAIQRFAGGYVAEKTVSVVELPSDDMKGRIIGREGRNIRAIEQVTGADVIIDDTPEVVVVSAFNPVRREIARLSLLRLVSDGRIHPARIEEVVEQVTAEMDQNIQRAGEQATFDLGVSGLHPELIKLVGKLRFRNVAGQNLWNHAIETASIGAMLATELGLNPALVKRAGLLHDIGKALDHEVEGPHWAIGAEQARRCGEKPEVVTAIRTYMDESPPTITATLLQVAAGISRERPGARRETLETYVKRLEELERIPMSFQGVEKAYALLAGREVRVIVDFAQVSDDDALLLSGDIARRIQDTLTYPGEVRVTVVREARATEIAR